ncbi:glycosyltransferase family 2 protein [Stella sp.]|uniref:glycosyltransferase family 2 protein n=1 Tax=Stella sp. TaxID=2912054 RepID=UPI0035B0B4D1
MTPRVEVVVPVFDGARHLTAAVERIEAQGVARLGILVVDDGSTDATPEICDRLAHDGRIRWTRTANGGPAAARNVGLGMARAPIVAFLDVDDEWPAGRLAWTLDYLEARPGLDGLVGQVQIVTDSPEAEAAWTAIGMPMYPAFFPQVGAGLFRRELFDRIGGFAVDLRYAEDIDWYFRWFESEPAVETMRRVMLFYHLHDANMTRHRAATRQGFAAAIARSLLRRRRRANPPPALPAFEDFLVEPPVADAGRAA